LIETIMPSIQIEKPTMLPQNDLKLDESSTCLLLPSYRTFLIAAKKRLDIQFIRENSRNFQSMPTKRRKIANKKCVRFLDKANNSKSKKFITTYIRPELDVDCKICWIQSHEYRELRKENMQVLMEFQKVKGRFTEMDVQKFCLRGLEKLATAYVFGACYNKSRWGPKRVVEFQKAQKQMGINDPESLREIAESFSKEDQIKAWKMALVDSFL
jgi:hypothetical protein